MSETPPTDARIADGRGRGRPLEILVDGRPLSAFAGETVAAVLLATGQRTLRISERGGEPRGVYCGIGRCFECRVTVDGRPGVRACVEPVRAGMTIETGTRAVRQEPRP